MYDPETAALIRLTPDLEGLDRDSLPEKLSEAFAQIVAMRMRLRAGDDVEDQELGKILREVRRLAFTNEALVSVSPERENRVAAAFVAGTAHQLYFNAERILSPDAPASFLGPGSISPDISAMLLFLVAEATADAGEIARRIRWSTKNPIERALITALRALAQGHLESIVGSAPLNRASVRRDTSAETAASALYLTILDGVRSLADLMLLGDGDAPEATDPVATFQHVKSLCVASVEEAPDGWSVGPISTFAGPFHLASLLIAVAGDLSKSSVVSVPPPQGIDPAKWRANMMRIAKSRPYLWRNHRDAIALGYLEPGKSAAVSFPTGAGKSVLAELKINAALLVEKKVVFLAPTLALVDQTVQAFRRSFPSSKVKREQFDEFGFLTEQDDLPEILVMTPERCLTQMSFDASVFDDAGLFVFDECHLLHPSDKPNDRRAIDAMLCVLNFARRVPEADLFLLSAMMKNTEEIAGWLEDLTGRTCLALSHAWKPTRQLRGSVVYQKEDIAALRSILAVEKRASTIKGVPVSVKRAVGARPLGFFSLKQTWATRAAADYVLLSLLEEKALLGIGRAWDDSWYLTPNSGEVASAIAAAAAGSGVKTLVFFQTIKNAASAASKVAGRLGSCTIRLTDDEAAWSEVAALELGGFEHLYLKIKDGKLDAPTAVHHGLLLPEERHLCESLFKRRDGVSVLTATSTLAQGMNLPSELVIIAEDSRFDEAKDARELLEAQELLNAAGRAGRAGENADGIVLVIPGKVVEIDFDNKTIGAYWTTLQKIFGQSDQCLDIDDPLTALLDRIHAGVDDTGDLERYCVGRLAGGGSDEGDTAPARLSRAIRSSLGGYRARRIEDEAWLESRINAATQFYQEQAPDESSDSAEALIAATLGMSLDVVLRLADRLRMAPPAPDASISDWHRWLFKWLTDNPDLIGKVFRPQSLGELFGKSYRDLEDDTARASFALPRLKKLSRLWMSGKPLCKLEAALGTPADKLKTCDGARKFVLRIVPELAYLFGLPVQLLQRAEADAPEPKPIPPALSQLALCARLGFDTHEKAALNYQLRSAHFSRISLHKHFDPVVPYLRPAPADETWEQTLDRVEAASMEELDNRE